MDKSNNTLEEWREYPVVKGYVVSSLGRIKSVKRNYAVDKFLSPVATNGYPRVTLLDNGRQFNEYVHRIVAAAFIGPCPEGEEVRHKDGDKMNCTSENLEYGTRSENAFDKRKHGKNPLHKLNWSQVRTIRAMAKAKTFSQSRIAEMFGINQSHVSRLASGQAGVDQL